MVVERIYAEDADTVMPPLESSKRLTIAQKDMLKRWIDDGGEYQVHWAYDPGT